jgi:Lrp/AsnC family leucine-responsive transcriptional regulator
MDRIDRDLLALIQRDGRQPYARLGKHVSLSAAAVHERLHKLATAGIIRHWSARVSAEAAGYPVLAFVRIQTDVPANARSLTEAVAAMAEVMEVHHIGGEWNCLLKIRAATPAALDDLVSEHIAALPGVLRLQTEQVLSSVKESHIVPTAQPGSGT